MAANEEHVNVSSFKVTLDGIADSPYESVAGIGIDIEDLPFQEGNNQIKNKSGRYTARDITISRRFKKDKALADWVKQTKQGKMTRKSGSVILLNDDNSQVARFNFFEAWPKSWSGPTLSKDRAGNETLMESVVLSVADVELA